jgi:hypothetical protein
VVIYVSAAVAVIGFFVFMFTEKAKWPGLVMLGCGLLVFLFRAGEIALKSG